MQTQGFSPCPGTGVTRWQRGGPGLGPVPGEMTRDPFGSRGHAPLTLGPVGGAELAPRLVKAEGVDHAEGLGNTAADMDRNASV